MSRIRIFAGPNGSGKSTLFRQVSERFNVGVFINADLIEQELTRSGLIDFTTYNLKISDPDFEEFKNTPVAGSLLKKAEQEGLPIDISVKENFFVDKSKQSHSYESALAALFIRKILVAQKKTFSFETVMSHPSKVEEIETATKNGYKAYLYFVCTDNPLVNIQRVDNRVDKGGHAVQDDKISSRYFKSLENLFAAIKVSYRTYLFDNSGSTMTLIAEIFADKLVLHSNTIPNWVEHYVLQHYMQHT